MFYPTHFIVSNLDKDILNIYDFLGLGVLGALGVGGHPL
jgi:hypothetical protein